MLNDQNDKELFFCEPKPTSIRIWHWLLFLLFTSTIITVIFASTMFRTSNNISMVQEQVQQSGGIITGKQARSVAHEYSDKLWMLHKYIGFGLSILLFWRIVIEIGISKEKKLRNRIKSALNYPVETYDRNHYVIVQYIYSVFYLLFLLIATTGLVLAFEDAEWLKPFHHAAKQIHSLIQWGMYGFIIMHLTGVITADLTRYGGIVSRMINGKARR